MVHLGPKKPPARKGSMVDVPDDLLKQVEIYRDYFYTKPEKLRAIVKHFITELDKGLSKKGGNIPMIPGWVVEFPDGTEKGDYLAIDLGGTNLRVVLVKLSGDRTFDLTQSKYRLPNHLRDSKDPEELWVFIGESLHTFIVETYQNGVDKPLPLGFTFSFPASQNKINQGVLQRWTKGFDIPDTEGQDVVLMLQKQLKKQNIPIEVVALINDTTGTLVASHYTDPETKMGVIFGTGVNGAYFDKVSGIEKLQGKLEDDITPDMPMAINCEYGSFDNEHLVLPRTKYDIQIDEESPRPGQQAFEKMTSGYYLGELLRLVLIELHEQGLILKDQDISRIRVAYSMDTSFPSKIEDDPFENLENTDDLFIDSFGIKTTIPERKIIRKICEFISTRAARISACGIGAICQKMGYETGHIAADGSIYNLYPGFKEKAHEALRDIYGWENQNDYKNYPISIVQAEDGSGAGAAIIAALTEKRLAAGKSVGILGA